MFNKVSYIYVSTKNSTMLDKTFRSHRLHKYVEILHIMSRNNLSQMDNIKCNQAIYNAVLNKQITKRNLTKIYILSSSMFIIIGIHSYFKCLILLMHSKMSFILIGQTSNLFQLTRQARHRSGWNTHFFDRRVCCIPNNLVSFFFQFTLWVLRKMLTIKKT